jgi:hypothetical protein
MMRRLAGVIFVVSMAACPRQAAGPGGTADAPPGPAATPVAEAEAEKETGAVAVAVDAAVAEAPVEKPAGDPPAAEVRTYALVVSFFSPGNGTDGEAFDRFEAMLKKQAPAPAHVTSRWGREGEHDECFTLAELDEAKKRAFIGKVKEAIGGSKRVNVKLDAECMGK